MIKTGHWRKQRGSIVPTWIYSQGKYLISITKYGDYYGWQMHMTMRNNDTSCGNERTLYAAKRAVERRMDG